MFNVTTSMSSSVLLGALTTGVWIGILIGALIVGAAAGILIYALSYKKTLKAAEQEKNKKIQEAIAEAKSLRKEAVLEAKEEIQRERTDLDKEIRDRRAELQRSEIRIQQKEETLDKKENQLDKKLENVEQFKQELAGREHNIATPREPPSRARLPFTTATRSGISMARPATSTAI